MGGLRRPQHELEAAAVDALTAALASASVAVAAVRTARAHDVVMDALVDDRPMRLAVEVKAYCTGTTARDIVTRRRPPGGTIPIVVAERITADARASLADAGWSYFDRRGHLHLWGPGVRIDIDVTPSATTGGGVAGEPIAGRSGLAVAYWLLAHPERSLSPTGQAAELGLAPSTISTTVRRLADAGLVDDARRAIIPELFWALAGAWRPERAWLVAEPGPRRHTPPDPHARRWRRTGTAAAAAWGAPVVTGSGGAPELYVPGPVEVSIARRRYGAAEPGSGRAVLVVAPAAPVCAGPADDPGAPDVGGWPAAPKLAVALDMAQDQARGREILDGWTDPDGVWR